MMLIILIFSRFFHCNVIIECYILVLVFSLYPPLWAVVSAVAAFLSLGAHVFIAHVVFLRLFVMCFLNKLMMMMMMECRFSSVCVQADPVRREDLDHLEPLERLVFQEG